MRAQKSSDFFQLTLICKKLSVFGKKTLDSQILDPLKLDRIGLAGVPLTDI